MYMLCCCETYCDSAAHGAFPPSHGSAGHCAPNLRAHLLAASGGQLKVLDICASPGGLQGAHGASKADHIKRIPHIIAAAPPMLNIVPMVHLYAPGRAERCGELGE